MAFPATYNIQYYSGDLYEFVIRPKTTAGDIYPITDSTYTAKFYISQYRGAPTGAATIEASVTIADNALTCSIFPSVGNQLAAGVTYSYDVSITKILDATVVHTLMTGTISVTDDITTP